ncbi:hypothetical protein [Cellulomonas sp. SG140]|uniref:hypothetical protein n=1 Tax=Cellulomonas sp. SG140 TaxID=2976536 RepID=UPI0021E779AB|nr:hypothetical protein [Cellulomonas sp. SG140]
MEWAALGRAAWACAARAQRPGGGTTAASSPLPPVDREAVLLAAAAAGHDGPTLHRLAQRLRTTPPGELSALLDPLSRQLRQRSGTTCGSACLVTARALADPVYALWLLEGFDARTGRHAGVDLADRFAAAERAVHARTTAPVLPGGRWQVPWPRALGTPPWAVATELTRLWGRVPADGRTGPAARFRTRLVDPDDVGSRRAAAEAVAAALAGGRVAALFVGDGAAPRHVTLAVGAVGPVLAVYEPGSGDVVRVPSAELVGGRAVLGGWDRLWAVVVPRSLLPG